jgi:monoamine oxidase
MGQALRITLRFREPFWEDREELFELGFLFSHDEQVPTWWTEIPVRTALITGWAAGPAAARLSGLGSRAIVDRALSSLGRMLGIDCLELERMLEGWYMHDWQSDPFSRGAYSYVLVGGVRAQEALAEPVEETL